MSFVISSFADLCARYNTWSELKTYLTSKDGGSLRVIELEQEGRAYSQYAIVRYVKGKSDMTKEHVRMFRSVVWNKETNRPVSVGPVKSEKGEPPVGADVNVSEFVDGVMINLWNHPTDGIQLATRTNLGATNSFYSLRNFYSMLCDGSRNKNLNDEFASQIPVGSFLNIVLQHPDHKTVGQIRTPRYYVTSSGTVSNDGSVTVDTTTSTAYKYASGKSVRELMNSGMRRGHMWQGLVFQDKTSHKRWRVRNPDFIRVRTLRGAEADPFERFLRLRSSGKTKEYLGFFREESNQLWSFEQLWRKRTKDLYDSYVEMNKLKRKTMKEIDLPLRTHVYALHGKYLASLPAKEGEEGKYPVPVTMETVIDYVNGLSLEDQMKIVNGAHNKLAVSR